MKLLENMLNILPLNPEVCLLCLIKNISMSRDPEKGEEDDTSCQNCGVELDTPEAGRERGTSQQNGHLFIAVTCLRFASEHDNNQDWD